MTEPVVLLDVTNRVATITLNRPGARNALSGEVLDLLSSLVAQAEADDDVDVLILTGADPAFCAGLDLRELGGAAPTGAAGTGVIDRATARGGPVGAVAKPIIAAVNGVAITGGLELALNCDFIVASEHARFADTHSRVGIMPGWGLSVLLPQAVGLRQAREMSFTGNFVTAHQALRWGLANHVVAHEELMTFCRQLAADIISNDQAGVRQLRATYAEIAESTGADGWEIERRDAKAWRKRTFDPAEVERRRAGIVERGRSQN